MDARASNHLSSRVLTSENSFFCRWLFIGLLYTKTIIHLSGLVKTKTVIARADFTVDFTSEMYLVSKSIQTLHALP